MVSRATSPQPDWSKGVRTRIAKTSDPIFVEKRRPRQPRSYEVSCQTEPHSEFGLLADYLQAVRPNHNQTVLMKSFLNLDYILKLDTFKGSLN